MADGFEHEVSVVVDAIAPAQLIVEMCRRFQAQFPTVTLRIHTELLDSVSELVLSGACQLGIAGPVGSDAPALTRRFLTVVTMIPVAAPTHPLATAASVDVRSHVQVVISRRATGEGAADIGVLSDHTWRVADAATKLALIRAGLGWGNLPCSLVESDLRSGALIRLALDEWGPSPVRAPLYTITRSDSPPGRAGQWLLQSLQDGDVPLLPG
jgi:DNA-binding transcriptional LysR family regulator